MIKNQIVTITIEDIGNDGEGIGKYEGYTLFVKGAVVGDVVKVKVLKAKKDLRLCQGGGNYPCHRNPLRRC